MIMAVGMIVSKIDRGTIQYNTIQYNIRLIKADRTQPVHNVKR